MKMQIQRGDTNFTLEFEDSEIGAVASSVGKIMTEAFGGTSMTIPFMDEVMADIVEEKRLEKTLEKGTPNPPMEELANSEQKRLEAQRIQDEKAQAEARERKEREAALKAKKDAAFKECCDADDAAKKLEAKLAAEEDEDVRAIISKKATTAREIANDKLRDFEAEFGTIDNEPAPAAKTEETTVVKTAEETTEEPAQPQEETKVVTEQKETTIGSNLGEATPDILKKGREIIETQRKSKMTTAEMAKELMNLFPGSKAMQLMSAINTFPEKKSFWDCIYKNKKLLEKSIRMSEKDIKEFDSLQKKADF